MKQLLLLLLAVQFVNAITIHGTIYDFDLAKLPNSLVEINSSPAQRLVAKEGTYSFNVPAGDYTLRATSKELSISEQLHAPSNGSYVLDLILLPSLETEEALLDQNLDQDTQLEIPAEFFIESKSPLQWLGWVVVFALLGLFIFWFASRKPRKTLPLDLQEILDFIHEQGGRTNQKDIYKNFNHSEAKISLMLDDLEGRGLVQRVKKGRGNLILQL